MHLNSPCNSIKRRTNVINDNEIVILDSRIMYFNLVLHGTFNCMSAILLMMKSYHLSSLWNICKRDNILDSRIPHLILILLKENINNPGYPRFEDNLLQFLMSSEMHAACRLTIVTPSVVMQCLWHPYTPLFIYQLQIYPRVEDNFKTCLIFI